MYFSKMHSQLIETIISNLPSLQGQGGDGFAPQCSFPFGMSGRHGSPQPHRGDAHTGRCAPHAGKAESLLRQALAKAGVNAPVTVDLELSKCTNNRRVKKLMFQPDQEIKDPSASRR